MQVDCRFVNLVLIDWAVQELTRPFVVYAYVVKTLQVVPQAGGGEGVCNAIFQ